MIDMSEFDNAVAKNKRRSMIDMLLDELERNDPEKHQQLLLALNETGTYSAPTIERVIRGWGFESSTTSIKEWRRKNA